MHPTIRILLLGALKSFVSSFCGSLISLPAIDAEHFNVNSYGGWKHIAVAAILTAAISEARFLKQWADTLTSNGKG